MKCLVLFISLWFVFGCAAVKPSFQPQTMMLAENPKVGAYWTSPTMSQEEAIKLARFHLVIADMENLVNNPGSLRLLKKLNPRIKLLAYSNPMEFFVPMVANRPLQKRMLDDVLENYVAWFLKSAEGNPVMFWKGMRMMNLSSYCPVINGLDWPAYHASFLLANVLADPLWDGYFMDNSGGNVSWIDNGNIDANNDHRQDNVEDLDQAWSGGIRKFLTTIRQAKGSGFILVGNKGSAEFLDLFNGKMFEEFPNDYLGDKTAGGWHQSMKNYGQTGPYSIIQSKPNGRLFGLASALLGGGYYVCGQNDNNWYDEYQDLGPALSKADEKFGRKFRKGEVMVWPEQRKGQIIYK